MPANELSCMNSHKQIVIEDSGRPIFMWQVFLCGFANCDSKEKSVTRKKLIKPTFTYISQKETTAKRRKGRPKRHNGAFQRDPAGPQGSTKGAFAIVSIC